MVQELEKFYNDAYAYVKKLELPRVMENPSGNPFADKNSITNAVISSFGDLNKLLSMLDQENVNVQRYLGDIRSPGTDGEDLISIVSELNLLFNKNKGLCMNIIRKKLEGI